VYDSTCFLTACHNNSDNNYITACIYIFFWIWTRMCRIPRRVGERGGVCFLTACLNNSDNYASACTQLLLQTCVWMSDLPTKVNNCRKSVIVFLPRATTTQTTMNL